MKVFLYSFQIFTKEFGTYFLLIMITKDMLWNNTSTQEGTCSKPNIPMRFGSY